MNRLTFRRRLALTVLALTFGFVLVASPSVQAAPPNVVIFLADDLGWGDLACYGHPQMKTPHLDRFATQGVRLTQCYSACGVCSPSRSAILTGRTPYRNGVFRWIPGGSEIHLPTSEITLAEQLKGLGYETCHVGKWHLNGKFNSSEQPQPGDHGFDWWMATQNNAAPSHKNPVNFVRNGKEVGPLQGYSSLLVVDEAIHWLGKERDKSQPFFLNVWTHEPHLPIESDPEFMKLYDTEDVGLAQHHGNVSQLDAAFGRLMATLEKMNLVENTIVVFTSDNGPEGSGKPNLKSPGSQRDRTRGSTGGLRGRKRDDWEGGIRVPGMVRWPGHVQPGSVSDTPVIGSDWFTTISLIAGAKVPADRVIDGADMRPAFTGKRIERPQPLYWRTHISSPDSRVAVRVGDWKIVANVDLDKFALFDVNRDWRETRDLSEANPDKFAEMKALLLKTDAAILADGPQWWKRDDAHKPKKR